MSDFYIETEHKARKQHKCFWCRRIVEVGEKYIKGFGVWQGDVQNRKECLKCHSLINVMSGDKDYRDYVYSDGFDDETLMEFHQEKICPTCTHYECEEGMTHRVRCDRYERNLLQEVTE
jgi:hypothetical protein